MNSGDIFYGTLVLFVAVAAYRLVRSRTTSVLAKIVVVGVALALLQDFHRQIGWQFHAGLGWLWRIVTPDRAVIAGLAAAVTLMLRDHYAPMVSEAGLVVRRLRSSAEANVQRQWREAEAEARERLEVEERATRSRMENEVRSTQAFIAQELERLRWEREAAVKEKERAARPNPYKVLGISPGATREEIKRRYRELVAAYHPDKAVDTTPEIRRLAEEKVKEINWAHEETTKERSHAE